jgi:hypothetical protein
MVSRIPLQAFSRKCFGGLTAPGIRHFLGPETQPLSDPRRPLLPLQQTQVEIVQAFKRYFEREIKRGRTNSRSSPLASSL